MMAKKFCDLDAGDKIYAFTSDILYTLTIAEVIGTNNYSVVLRLEENEAYKDFFQNTSCDSKIMVGKDADVYYYHNGVVLFADKETVRDYLETLKKRIDIMINLLN